MSHYFENDKNLKSNMFKIESKINNVTFSFYSDNGVFSKDKIDYGSRLLLDNIIKRKIYGNVLDVGCGYGVIGVVCKKFFKCNVDMIDINERAIFLTSKNCELNLVICNSFLSDKYENVSKKYDFIITNPPIRVGKKALLDILIDAKNYLDDNGELWFVMRKNHGVLSIIKNLESEYFISIVDKDKGFYIVSCIKKD